MPGTSCNKKCIPLSELGLGGAMLQMLLHSEMPPDSMKSCRDSATILISHATREKATLLGMHARAAQIKAELTQNWK